ncbi:hypothetical protein [Saccharothrix deserti]|uniref:hypothetical protein n=1 Tax=Saccharothrix deserti TaxID=2593674 RepID=UPI00131B3407|nr:hypothetical protein [Saccharothrix deserti]
MSSPPNAAADSSPDRPINVACFDAAGRQRVTQVYLRDARIVVLQPSPGTSFYDWHGAAELASAVDQLRKRLPGTAQ